MKYDYSDMFDIVSFFDGPPTRSGVSERDDLARQIADSGRQFAMERLR
jgi:beta-1,2-xylosyltransferase